MSDQDFQTGQRVYYWNGEKYEPADVVVVTANHCMIRPLGWGGNKFIKQSELSLRPTRSEHGREVGNSLD